MATVYLSLGSNMGRRLSNLRRAILLLKINGLKILKLSSVYETEPLGFKRQRQFFNLALKAETQLSALKLLGLCKRIERELGRKRTFRFGPRPIDIDILLYGRKVTRSRRLTIPHPRMHERKFVLVPLAEIAPQVVHPLRHATIEKLRRECADTSMVKKYCVLSER